MDFNSLFTYYTCFNTIEEFIQEKNLNRKNAIPVVEIQHNDLKQAEAVLYSMLSVKDQSSFNLLIAPAGKPAAVNRKWLSQIVSIVSHAAYNKFHDRKIIFFNEGQWSGAREGLIKEMKSLGFKDLLPVYLEDVTAYSNESINFFLMRSADDEKKLLEVIQSKIYSLSHPFQLILQGSVSKNLESVKEKLQSYIQQHYKPEELQLLQKVFSLNQNISVLQNTLLNKENLLTSRQAYLDFLLNQYPADDGNGRINEELKIRKFYHYEYEVLPLWYKQLGHVIKVIMGKRTFKSLFDDKAKKYKD